MNHDQFVIASQLERTKFLITKELEVWEKDFTSRSKLSCKKNGENYGVCLTTNIADDIFMSFRSASITYLKLRLSEIDKEFSEL